MKKPEKQQPRPEVIRVRVVAPVVVTGYGTLEPGFHDLPADIARLVVERGFAVEDAETAEEVS